MRFSRNARGNFFIPVGNGRLSRLVLSSASLMSSAKAFKDWPPRGSGAKL